MLVFGRETSTRLILSYVFDWVIIIIVAGVGGVLYKISGYEHAFSLEDPQISYPLVTNTISVVIVAIVAGGVPAVLILVLSLLIPSSALEVTGEGEFRSLWSRRLWEWHAGWLGLGLSLAGAFFITSGLKDVVGKPRPDFLARCDPDLSNIAPYVVGGLGLNESSAPVMVNVGICQNTNLSVLKDGFAAFPSGHSSFSWAGLLYLSLWLSAKFAVTFPAPDPTSIPRRQDRGADLDQSTDKMIPFRSSAAASPLYLVLFILTPVAVALFICATRYADYMHAGWDILAGSLIGAFFAWFGFRWYHVASPGGESSKYGAWAWAPRSTWGAFGVPFGSSGFASNEDRPLRVPIRDARGYEDLELRPVR
ncbi:diacylglycerol pyrophosphate phosphatase [Penicillium tannophilum]|nr:diacylglycerol pyrophosphate phosphatase [Penicillium tannophilum]